MNAPLRRVVWKGYFPLCSNGVWALALYEMLECGHWQLKKSSMLGPYKAVRRRCNACALLKKD